MKKKLIIPFIFSLFSVSCSSGPTYKISDHYNGSVFFNPWTSEEPKGLIDVIKWKFTGHSEAWPDKIDPPYKLATPIAKSTDKMIVTFVTHASFLIQVDGLNILTDPVWSKRASPFSFAGPKMVHPPGIEFEKLPKIDIVIISHNHYDHMDETTIKRLQDKFAPKFIVPLANTEKMKSFGAKDVAELDWWDSLVIQPDFKITLTPAQHWSSRTLWDKRKSLWGSFFIETKKEKIYFAGDTGYGPHFAQIHKRLGTPNLALLPIGAYEPRWFMKEQHMNPEEAVLAHLDLGSEHSVGMHFGTFKLTDEGIRSPVEDLETAKKKLNVENFKTLDPGESVEL
jgi:L-ascorbate metabolism protein UlaG (beta-lactamase superfamily)